jgi:hypothetical protein
MADSDFDMDLSLQVGKYEVVKVLGKGATGTYDDKLRFLMWYQRRPDSRFPHGN